MRLRNISIFFIVGIALINLLASCNDSETESVSTILSADAQIYSFSATYIPRNYGDTVSRNALVKAKFAINQSSHMIYNVDSLPYGFSVKMIAASMTFSSSTPTATQIVYPNDSIIDWESASDSIDFTIYPKSDASLNGVPQVKFKVTPQNGTTAPYDYVIKLLIHQVDPDSIVWVRKADLPNAFAQSKALYINNEYYYYGTSGNSLSTYKTADGGAWTTVNSGATFPANVRIESLSLLGNNLYVADVDNNVYQSPDFGATWNTSPIASNVINIVGSVRKSSTIEGLITIIDDGGVNKLAFTTDFTTFSDKIPLDEDFPISEYTSTYDAKNNRQLVVGGQKEGAADYINTTWWITYLNGGLQVIENTKTVPFDGGSRIVSFLYDDKLYVWAKEKSETEFKLYSSDGGLNWKPALPKQYFHEEAKATNGQTIIVDKDGYIWTFGGITNASSTTKEVWRGMMRKMGFKK